MLKPIPLAAVLLVAAGLLSPSSANPPAQGAFTSSCPFAERTFLPSDEETADPADGLVPEERAFIDLINTERTSRGENALTLSPMLVRVARSHSREMAARAYFDHCSPMARLRTPVDRYLAGLRAFRRGTPDYALVGENIYYCSKSTETYNVGYGHQALMNSPTHRANILEPRFSTIGVGFYRNDRGEFWVTEMFLDEKY